MLTKANSTERRGRKASDLRVRIPIDSGVTDASHFPSPAFFGRVSLSLNLLSHDFRVCDFFTAMKGTI